MDLCFITLIYFNILLMYVYFYFTFGVLLPPLAPSTLPSFVQTTYCWLAGQSFNMPYCTNHYSTKQGSRGVNAFNFTIPEQKFSQYVK